MRAAPISCGSGSTAKLRIFGRQHESWCHPVGDVFAVVHVSCPSELRDDQELLGPPHDEGCFTGWPGLTCGPRTRLQRRIFGAQLEQAGVEGEAAGVSQLRSFLPTELAALECRTLLRIRTTSRLRIVTPGNP